MKDQRFLIVNADDFGLSCGTNRGIIEAHERGIVTSASLMVRPPAAREAAEYARAHRELSLGLHIDLTEWEYRDGRWHQLYEVVPGSDAKAVTEEVERQLAEFHRLTGVAPTHLDSHQHVHREEPLRHVLIRFAQEAGIPLRHFSPRVSFFGGFFGQGHRAAPFPEGITIENLCEIMRTLPPGVTELGCHPGLDADLASIYRDQRLDEVKTLCDPRVRAELDSAGLELLSFSTLPPGR